MQQVLRDPMSMFFAIIFPVLLVTAFSLIYGSEAQWGGLPLPQYLAAAFAVYGVGTMAFVNLPGSIADQRALGVLKRMRGTPLPPLLYLVGRVLAALVLGLATLVLVFVVAVAFLAVSLPPSTWAATLLTFVLAILCFAACGLALVSLVDSPQAVIALALSILLPLSFFSDIFISIEEMPTTLNAIGWTFPLRHAVAAAVTATSGGALDGTFWGHLAVLVLWTGIGLLVAWRFFHWEPRRARS
jgi:ABC-2 type transport system permease protein